MSNKTKRFISCFISGVEIDDNTPANNKVFSSAKVDEELTDVKTAIQGVSAYEESRFAKSRIRVILKETLINSSAR